MAAGGFDLAAGEDAAAVGQEDDLEEDGGVVGSGALKVVLVAGVEGSEVELLVRQMAEGEFECARLDLLLEMNGKGVLYFGVQV